MIKKNHILSFFCLINFMFGQTNIVQNGDFEFSINGFSCGIASTNYSALTSYWAHNWPWTPPLEKPFCFNGVGSAGLWCTGGYSGPHYAECTKQEYIFQNLSTQIDQGKEYYIEFYVKGTTSLIDGGIKFFNTQPSQCIHYPITHDGSPTLAIPSGLNISSWTKVSTNNYIADNNYTWIGLGKFNSSDNDPNDKTYYFDDIKIYCTGPNACPPFNSIQNWSFENIGEIKFSSSQLTIAGSGVDNTKTFGPVYVSPTGTVTLKSETTVEIQDEFIAEEGSQFVADILPCGSDCQPPSVFAVDDFEACSSPGTQLNLGFDPNSDQTYHWTNANQNGSATIDILTFLSATNVSNPVFTVPSGSGQFTYLVSTTNACGQTASDQVTVIIEDNPDPNPAITVSDIDNTSTTNYINFTLSNYSLHTQTIYIEVYDYNTNPLELVTTYEIQNPQSTYNGNPINWQIPDHLSFCKDYEIHVYAKNYCSSNLSAPAIINWIRNNNPVVLVSPNIFTPMQGPSGGTNDELCFTVYGATAYTVQVLDPGNAVVYNAIQSFTPPTACVWNGTCNSSNCSIFYGPDHILDDGTYYVVYQFRNDCGNVLNDAHYVQLFNTQHRLIKVDSSGNEVTDIPNFSIYPNPSKELFIISSSELLNGGVVTIKNILGENVMQSQIPIGSSQKEISWGIIENGIYFVEFENSKTKIRKRIIKQ